MGTHSNFNFCINGLEFDVGFDSSYGIFATYSPIPKFWSGSDEKTGESKIIFDVVELLKYWGENPPQGALLELYKLLSRTPLEDICCYPYTWDGFPKGVDGQGKITLSYGL